jgi:hypothetical protein
MHPQLKAVKVALENEDTLAEILKVFNQNGEGYPIIGSWMLFECSRNAAKRANTWTGFGVSADAWKDLISFSPNHITLNNGKGIIKEAEDVVSYPITTKSKGGKPGSSFFVAYQTIKAGAKFKFAISYSEDLCTKIEGRGQDKQIVPDPEKSTQCVEAVLDKMQTRGLGAYSVRFGKFEYI